MNEKDIYKLVSCFSWNTSFRMCIITAEGEVGVYGYIPKCENEHNYTEWKIVIQNAVKDLIYTASCEIVRATASGKNEVTLYFRKRGA